MIFIKKLLMSTIIVSCMSCYSYSERGWGSFVDVKPPSSYQNNYPKNYGGVQTNRTTNYNTPTAYSKYDPSSPYYNDDLNIIFRSDMQIHNEINDKLKEIYSKKIYNHMRDIAHDHLIEKLANNANSLIYNKNNDAYFVNRKEVLYEITFFRGCILKTEFLQKYILDSTLILEKIHTIDGFIEALSSPAVQARLQRIQYLIKMNGNDNSFRKYKYILEKESAFIDMILSGRISKILHNICYSDIVQAEAAFKKLTQLWPYEQNYNFLVPSFSDKHELQFIQDLGVDIMKIAQINLITNSDYLARHCDPHSLQKIKEYRDECVKLIKTCDDKTLLNKKLLLIRSLEASKSKNDFVKLTKLAFAEKIYDEQVTQVFKLITHEQSFEKACNELKQLEQKIINEGKQRNIFNSKALAKWVVNRYGFNVLDAARECYISRADYIFSPEYKTHFSEKLLITFDTIENGTLSTANEQLVHCEQSVKQFLASSTITDETAQKEYIIKEFGVDVINFARNLYEKRADYQNLVTSFIPIDVSSSMTTILETQFNPIAIADEFNILSQQVFNNVRYYDAEMFAQVEPHIDESIDVLRTTKDFREFVFHTIIIDRVLNDAQATVQAAVDGKPTLLERSPELIVRAVTKFVCALNPITQAENIYEFAKDAGYLMGKTLVATTKAVMYPFDNFVENIQFFSGKDCEFLVNAACFVSDLTIGKTYLSPEEYQHRTKPFWSAVNAISAEQLVDLGAQIAADFVFAKGLGNIYVYLKEINAICKRRGQAAKIARELRNIIDISLAEKPIVITAEGIVQRIDKSNLRRANRRREVIRDTKTFLENIETKIANNSFNKLDDQLAKRVVKDTTKVTENLSSEVTASKESTAINNVRQETKNFNIIEIVKQRFAKTKSLRDILDQYIEKLLKTVSHERVGTFYDLPTLEILPKEKWAEDIYNVIRTHTLDVQTISKNTNIPESIIQRIKNHVFLEEHILREGVGKFFPDPDIAVAWQRLINNKFIKSDLILLQHEYAESLIMNGLEISYQEAHDIVETLYNWRLSL